MQGLYKCVSNWNYTYLVCQDIQTSYLLLLIVTSGKPTVTKDGHSVRTVKVADRTGAINMSVWDDVGDQLQTGDICRITKGLISFYWLPLYHGTWGVCAEAHIFGCAEKSSLSSTKAIILVHCAHGRHVHSICLFLSLFARKRPSSFFHTSPQKTPSFKPINDQFIVASICSVYLNQQMFDFSW